MTLSMLARYYYHECGYDKQEIISSLNSFMENYYPRYNPIDWIASIEICVSKADRYSLCECDGVWITESELSKIDSINNKVLERLAFTLLCLAKFRNFRNSNNNGWVSDADSEVYKMACITTTAFDKGIRYNQLRELGLIQYAKKINNLNIQVLFIDDESDKKIFINDFRKIGYEWRLYKGEKYIRCADCGILTRKSKHNQKYCASCAKQNPYYSPIETKIIKCIDCGEEFEVDSKDNKTTRCCNCLLIHKRKLKKLEMQRYRLKKNSL